MSTPNDSFKDLAEEAQAKASATRQRLAALFWYTVAAYASAAGFLVGAGYLVYYQLK